MKKLRLCLGRDLPSTMSTIFSLHFIGNPDCVVRQVRQTTWPEVTRLFNTGLAGFWAMAVFLIVGFSACHITGPSVVMSVVITAVTAVLTGKFFSCTIYLFLYFFLKKVQNFF